MKIRHRLRRVAMETGKSGFVRVMERHAALFYKRGPVLIVTFDNLKSREMPAPAVPWAYRFIAQEGHSHLAITMQRRNDWFRRVELEDYFDDLSESGFFSDFEHVVFYGSSMGGYGALSLAAAVPGVDVVAFSPQSSLDPEVVPFETRFGEGFKRGDWSGRYADAVLGAERARRVTIFVDPWDSQDAAHVERLPQDNLVWAKCPFAGHKSARVMRAMGILSGAVRLAWRGELTEQAFRKSWRQNRASQTRARIVLEQALEADHPALVLSAVRRLREQGTDWHFPHVSSEARVRLRQGHADRPSA